jgi:hypothetical protein
VGVNATDDGFAVETEAGDRVQTASVVTATKNEIGYIADADGVGIVDRGKTFVDRTNAAPPASTASTQPAGSLRRPTRRSSAPDTARRSP